MATVVFRLRHLSDADPDERLRNVLLRFIEDPLEPRGDKGKVRINPILVLLAAMVLLAVGTFSLFSLLQP
jgi:hypothetical protein